MRREKTLGRLEQAAPLDGLVDWLSRRLRRAVRPPVSDFLHGVWLGHPLHPALVDVPIGAWTSAAILDAAPRSYERSARLLIGAGLAAAVPSALAGATDWASLSREQQRIGLVHAAVNFAAVSVYGASLVARLRGSPSRGRRLAFLGLGVAGVGAFLGGHLTYRQAAGVNHAALAPPVLPEPAPRSPESRR